MTDEALSLAAPRSRLASTHPDGDAPCASVREAGETVVEIGPDGNTREWRVGAMEVEAGGGVEREWGLGRV